MTCKKQHAVRLIAYTLIKKETHRKRLEQVVTETQLQRLARVTRLVVQRHSLLQLAAWLEVPRGIEHHLRRGTKRQVHQLGVGAASSGQPSGVPVPVIN
jgi:hypothetical protein